MPNATHQLVLLNGPGSKKQRAEFRSIRVISAPSPREALPQLAPPSTRGVLCSPDDFFEIPVGWADSLGLFRRRASEEELLDALREKNPPLPLFGCLFDLATGDISRSSSGERVGRLGPSSLAIFRALLYTAVLDEENAYLREAELCELAGRSPRSGEGDASYRAAAARDLMQKLRTPIRQAIGDKANKVLPRKERKGPGYCFDLSVVPSQPSSGAPLSALPPLLRGRGLELPGSFHGVVGAHRLIVGVHGAGRPLVLDYTRKLIARRASKLARGGVVSRPPEKLWIPVHIDTNSLENTKQFFQQIQTHARTQAYLLGLSERVEPVFESHRGFSESLPEAMQEDEIVFSSLFSLLEQAALGVVLLLSNFQRLFSPNETEKASPGRALLRRMIRGWASRHGDNLRIVAFSTLPGEVLRRLEEIVGEISGVVNVFTTWGWLSALEDWHAREYLSKHHLPPEALDWMSRFSGGMPELLQISERTLHDHLAHREWTSASPGWVFRKATPLANVPLLNNWRWVWHPLDRARLILAAVADLLVLDGAPSSSVEPFDAALHRIGGGDLSETRGGVLWASSSESPRRRVRSLFLLRFVLAQIDEALQPAQKVHLREMVQSKETTNLVRCMKFEFDAHRFPEQHFKGAIERFTSGERSLSARLEELVFK